MFAPRNDKNSELLRSPDTSVLFRASSKELPRGTIREQESKELIEANSDSEQLEMNRVCFASLAS